VGSWIASNAQAVYDDIQSYVIQGIDNVITTVVNGLGNGLTYAASTVESAITGAVQSALNIIVNAFDTVVNLADGVAAYAGPFAPVVTTLILALVFVGGMVVFYYVGVILFAVGKTAFNLL
jgi:phage-related protein